MIHTGNYNQATESAGFLTAIKSCLPVFTLLLLMAHHGSSLLRKRFARRFNRRVRKGWWHENLGMLLFGALVLCAMGLAALLGASLLWVLLTGVLTIVAAALIVFILFVTVGGDRYRGRINEPAR